MRNFIWVILLLPLVELYLLITIGSQIGAMLMVLWVVLAVVLGGGLIRNAGMATALLVREKMARGEHPDAEMLTGFMWVIAGILLIFPGPLSDFLALICLLPVTRKWLARRMQGGFVAGGGYTRRHEGGSRDDSVIEGEYSREQDDKRLP